MNNSNIFSTNNVYTIDVSDTMYTSTSTPNSTLTVATSDWDFNITPDFQVSGDAHVQGDLKVEGDIVVQGQDLKSWMQRVEQRLAILKPAPELELEFAELRKLGDQYRKLQAELEAKMRTWQALRD